MSAGRENSDRAAAQGVYKRAVADFDRATRPVVSKVLDLAQKGIAQGMAAVQAAEANVDTIADAAVRVAYAQADLLASSRAPSPVDAASDSAPRARRTRRKRTVASSTE
jgi:hypothetical protein